MSRVSTALAILLVAPAVWGNAAAEPMPSRLDGVSVGAPTPIEVRRERLRIECVSGDLELQCSFEAQYDLENPTPTRQEIVAAFDSFDGDLNAVTQDGRQLPRVTLTPELKRALTMRLAGVHPDWANDFERAWGFQVAVDAGFSAVLRLRGSIHPHDLRFRLDPVPAVSARHPAFGIRIQSFAQEYLIRYHIAPIWTWGGHPDLEVELVLPNGYRGGGRQYYPSGKLPRELSIRVERPAPILLHGGLLLGVGATTGQGVRFRAGWEIAQPANVLYSLVWETNARDRHYVVPMVMTASASIWGVFPSFGLGAGMPIELTHRRAGGRIAVDMQCPGAGLGTAVDIFPDEGVQVTLMGQVAL